MVCAGKVTKAFLSGIVEIEIQSIKNFFLENHEWNL